MFRQPPRKLRIGFHVVWEMHMQHERTLSQMTMGTRKMIGQRQPQSASYYHKPRECEPQGRALLLGSLTFCFLPGCPFPMKFFFFFFSLTFYFWDPWDFKIMFSMFSTFRHFRQYSIYKRINIGINGIKYCSELDTHIYDELGFNKGARQFNG